MQFPRIDQVVNIDANTVKSIRVVLKNTTIADQLRLGVVSPENPGGGEPNWITIASISSNNTGFQTYILNDILVLQQQVIQMNGQAQ